MFLRDTIFNNVNNLLFHFSDNISKYEFDQVFNDCDQPENGNFNGKFYYTKNDCSKVYKISIYSYFLKLDYRAKNASIQKYRLKLI